MHVAGLGMTKVIPFPLPRRFALIGRAARRMASMHPKNRESYLIVLLELLQEELRAAGIDQAVIDNQLIALARAIKAAAHVTGRRQPGGVA